MEFRVVKKIGEGAFGKVYQIKDLSSNKMMAIKTIDMKSNFNMVNDQATGSTKIYRGGGVFSKIFRPEGILPEVSNFGLEVAFLALLSHN